MHEKLAMCEGEVSAPTRPLNLAPPEFQIGGGCHFRPPPNPPSFPQSLLSSGKI